MGLITPLKHFDLDADRGKQLWRYLDFSRFISLLHTRSLVAVRPDFLGDPWEGALTRPSVESKLKDLPRNDKDRNEFLARLMESMARPLRKYAVSCWHMHQGESAAMWDLYSQRSSGIAVLSSVDRLLRSIDVGDHAAWIATVRYLNYHRDEGADTPPDSLFQKRGAYSHEQEFRLVLGLSEPEAAAVQQNASMEGRLWFVVRAEAAVTLGAGHMRPLGPARGIAVPVDLDNLVEAIYVAPSVPLWGVELVNELLRRFGLKVEAIHSDVGTPPILAAMPAFIEP